MMMMAQRRVKKTVSAIMVVVLRKPAKSSAISGVE